MDRVVVFLGDCIKTEDLQAVEAYFSQANTALYFYRMDNSTLEVQTDYPKYRLLGSNRHFEYLAWVFQQIETLHATVKKNWLKNLIQIARYEIFEKHTESLYIPWAIEKLRLNHPAAEFYFLPENAKPTGSFQKKVFQGIPVHIQAKPLKNSAIGLGFRYFSKKLRKIISQTGKQVATPTVPEVLFIENYAHSARISNSLQSALNDHGVKAGVLALNALVWETVHKAGTSLKLEHATTRWNQLYAWLCEGCLFYAAPVIFRRYRTDNSIFERLLDGNFYYSLARANWFKPIFRRMVAHQAPKLVLSTSLASLPVRAMMMACQDGNIETGYIQHGIHSPYGVAESWMLQQHFFLWGQYDKQFFQDKGINATRLFLTGAPKIGLGLHKNPVYLPKKAPEILYLPQRTGGVSITPYEAKEMLSWFTDACASLKNAQGRVKFHPGDLQAAVLGDCPGTTIVSADIPASTLIQQADIVLTGFSTTAGLEAIAFGKPLIVLITPNRTPVIPYQKYGAALYVHNKQELRAAIASLTENMELVKSLLEGGKRLLADFYEYTGEDSTKIFLEKIQLLLHK